MAKWDDLKMRRQIVAHGNLQIRAIDRETFRLQNEREMWEAIVEQQGLCRACNGDGKTRVFIAQDETSLEACEACKGTGKR